MTNFNSRKDRAKLDQQLERRIKFSTSSGIPLKRVFLSEGESDSSMDDLAMPGQYPYTRGIYPTMYRGRYWTMRQYAGYASADETNRRFKFLLEQGQTGLSVAFDLPTQIGYDPDDPLAEGEVGKVGVSISTLEDMYRLFDGIPMEKVSTSMTINAPAAILLAMYISVAKRQQVDINKLRGTIQNDILKEYLARGTYIFPPAPSLRLVTDVFRYCDIHLPYWNTISISGYHIREAGSTAVQEVAFTLANAITYVESAINSGLKIDNFAPRISFFFNAHNEFLEEIAKFRAARRMWAGIIKNRFSCEDPKSQMMRFHAQTGGSTLTAQQPENNVTRVTIQALAAVLGGAQSIHTNSMDEALALPTASAAQVALRTQQIIAHESGVADIVDPLGGGYAIESLTNEIQSRAEKYIRHIDDIGGSLAAIESGYMQGEIHDAAYAYQKNVEQGDQVVVGVNNFADDKKLEIDRLILDKETEEQQCERVRAIREQRDSEKTSTLLDQLSNAARGTDNLMPLFIECVQHDVTLGEICNVLRNVWGEYRSLI
ncbi:MAG: methylmalonyl-CoA mutase [Anaerolineaceae bacterium]|nr:methylmalonyl-CoA mutase [Anaerolineaceae bacterium]|tara:strand:- start:17548 stop:19179 length:1632 start_codon:yes stop_codon:yes gene_type:complete